MDPSQDFVAVALSAIADDDAAVEAVLDAADLRQLCRELAGALADVVRAANAALCPDCRQN